MTDVPPNAAFQRLVLRALHELGGTASRQDVIAKAVALGRFSKEQLEVPPPPRNTGKFQNRVQFECSFALSHLKEAGKITNPQRGIWTLVRPA